MRTIVRLALSASLVGCASMQARSNATNTAKNDSQVVLTVGEPTDRVISAVITAFQNNGLTVSSTQNNLVESKLPREQGLLGSYDMVVRALVVQSGSATQVTLYGVESLGDGSTTETVRVSNFSKGRAGTVWGKLKTIAGQLQPDAAKVQIVGNP